MRKIKLMGTDAKVAAAVDGLSQDKDVEVLRTMGQSLQVGLTSCKHQGLSNGADRDAEIRKANTV